MLKAKKILSLLFVLSLVGCNSPSPDASNSNSIDPAFSSFSALSKNEGDESNQREVNKKTNTLLATKFRLPAIPLVPVFAAFNND